jgi:aspartyl/asparaginyl-tRNA synthetase
MRLNWFGHDIFLSESSQLYLEFTLAFSNFTSVFSIYNSFRKEKADWCHLSEFHHIEYEGKVDQRKNEEIIIGLLKHIIKDILQNCEEEILSFVDKDYISYLENSIKNVKRLPLYNVLQTLYLETGLSEYKNFTTKFFGSWEEIKITNLVDGFVFIKEFPYYSSFFYQTYVEGNGKNNVEIDIYGKKVKVKSYEGIPVADTADLIWPGYREVCGSGHRVRDAKEAEYKIRWLFNQTLKIDEETTKN